MRNCRTEFASPVGFLILTYVQIWLGKLRINFIHQDMGELVELRKYPWYSKVKLLIQYYSAKGNILINKQYISNINKTQSIKSESIRMNLLHNAHVHEIKPFKSRSNLLHFHVGIGVLVLNGIQVTVFTVGKIISNWTIGNIRRDIYSWLWCKVCAIVFFFLSRYSFCCFSNIFWTFKLS